MIPLLRVEGFVGRCRLVVAVAYLEYVRVDLHVAETHAADSFDAHDRADVGIRAGEALHVNACLERELRKRREIGVLLERGHFIDVPRTEVDRLADDRCLQHDVERARGFEYPHAARYGGDADRYAVGHAFGESVDARHREFHGRRRAEAGFDDGFRRADRIAVFGRNPVVLAVFPVEGVDQLRLHLDLHVYVLPGQLRGGDRERRFGRGLFDRHRLVGVALGVGHIDRRIYLRLFLTARSRKKGREQQRSDRIFQFHGFVGFLCR